MNVLSSYLIHEETYCLLPAAHFDYSTIVVEKDRKLFIKQAPLQIVKASCLAHCSTYEGRRKAVMHHTGFSRKVPIPINPNQNILTFPTRSPEEFTCRWIMPRHVLHIQPICEKVNSQYQSIITFKNGVQLEMEESCYVLEKQLQRSWMCVVVFGKYKMHEMAAHFVSHLPTTNVSST
ncbi:competence protein ComK [Gracilibacillus dipsosauri]|uniref:competence protein ComK n=1 Tax=Gracilibacillus dipsosauri TaxID=178340 RepID=UPI0024096DF1